MTHDELLTQLDYDRPERFGEYAAALRAVVELHTPDSDNHCLQCGSFASRKPYPCFTIQAIEKEL